MQAPLPTLMQRGKLRALNPQDQPSLDEEIPYEHILHWVRSRQGLSGPKNRVLVLKSETASGKSTLVPAELYRHFVRVGTGRGLICTQPRVLTAVENVNEILKNYSTVLKLGSTIGWSTKENKLRPSNPASILSATVGTLAQELRQSSDAEIIAKYEFILIDETHERDIETDIVLFMLRNMLRRLEGNVSCPFVFLMSATIDPTPFTLYYDVPLEECFIWCVGASNEIVVQWPTKPAENYIDAAVEAAQQIVEAGDADAPGRGDVMCFLPGAAEAQKFQAAMMEFLTERRGRGRSEFLLLQLSGVNVKRRNADYIATVAPLAATGAQRRIIAATNVAETGLTLEGLKAVIDSGYNREVEYNPVLDAAGIVTKPAPQNRIWQRRGRAGRKFRGEFYPLYTSELFDMLPKYQHPQILISRLAPYLLQIMKEQKRNDDAAPFRLEELDMLTNPAPDAMFAALETLTLLGALRESVAGAAEMTELGAAMLAVLEETVDVKPETIRAVFAAIDHGIDPVIVATACCGFDVLLSHGKIAWNIVYAEAFGIHGKEWNRAWPRNDFLDQVALIYAAQQEIAAGHANLMEWERSIGLHRGAILDLLRRRENLLGSLLAAGVDLGISDAKRRTAMSFWPHGDAAAMAECRRRFDESIVDGFLPFLCIQSRSGRYYPWRGMHQSIDFPRQKQQNAEPPIAFVASEFAFQKHPIENRYSVVGQKICPISDRGIIERRLGAAAQFHSPTSHQESSKSESDEAILAPEIVK